MLIPIFENYHWSLISIDFLFNEIKYYDSLSGHNQKAMKVGLYLAIVFIIDISENILSTCEVVSFI